MSQWNYWKRSVQIPGRDIGGYDTRHFFISAFRCQALTLTCLALEANWLKALGSRLKAIASSLQPSVSSR